MSTGFGIAFFDSALFQSSAHLISLTSPSGRRLSLDSEWTVWVACKAASAPFAIAIFSVAFSSPELKNPRHFMRGIFCTRAISRLTCVVLFFRVGFDCGALRLINSGYFWPGTSHAFGMWITGFFVIIMVRTKTKCFVNHDCWESHGSWLAR